VALSSILLAATDVLFRSVASFLVSPAAAPVAGPFGSCDFEVLSSSRPPSTFGSCFVVAVVLGALEGPGFNLSVSGAVNLFVSWPGPSELLQLHEDYHEVAR
jgi:hypothetical protein